MEGLIIPVITPPVVHFLFNSDVSFRWKAENWCKIFCFLLPAGLCLTETLNITFLEEIQRGFAANYWLFITHVFKIWSGGDGISV